MPGHHRPQVYQWEQDDDGVRVWMEVYRNCVDDIWENYTDLQCQFDPFKNEWDICTEFAPDDKVANSDTDGDYYGDANEEQQHQEETAPPPYPLASPVPPNFTVATHKDLIGSYRNPDRYDPLSCALLKDMLYLRYGYTFSSFHTPYPDDATWSTTQRILADTESPLDVKGGKMIIQFVNTLHQ